MSFVKVTTHADSYVGHGKQIIINTAAICYIEKGDDNKYRFSVAQDSSFVSTIELDYINAKIIFDAIGVSL